MKKRVYTDCREINGKRAIYQIHEELDKTTGEYEIVKTEKIADDIQILGQGKTANGSYALIVGFDNEMGIQKRSVKTLIDRSELGESKCFNQLRGGRGGIFPPNALLLML